MRYISEKICRENQNTHLMFSKFFSENRAAEKYCTAGQVTDEIMAHTHCILDI
jgi:hypothetical protein